LHHAENNFATAKYLLSLSFATGTGLVGLMTPVHHWSPVQARWFTASQEAMRMHAHHGDYVITNYSLIAHKNAFRSHYKATGTAGHLKEQGIRLSVYPEPKAVSI
jgi:hypothetical protein